MRPGHGCVFLSQNGGPTIRLNKTGRTKKGAEFEHGEISCAFRGAQTQPLTKCMVDMSFFFTREPHRRTLDRIERRCATTARHRLVHPVETRRFAKSTLGGRCSRIALGLLADLDRGTGRANVFEALFYMS